VRFEDRCSLGASDALKSEVLSIESDTPGRPTKDEVVVIERRLADTVATTPECPSIDAGRS
jgi:hypothetical protein